MDLPGVQPSFKPTLELPGVENSFISVEKGTGALHQLLDQNLIGFLNGSASSPGSKPASSFAYSSPGQGSPQNQNS